MPTVDVTAVTAHNTNAANCLAAMYRPLRRVGGGAVDPAIVAAIASAAAAIAATNAATQNPAQAAALLFYKARFAREQKIMNSPLGVRRRRAYRAMRRTSMTLAALHQVNTP